MNRTSTRLGALLLACVCAARAVGDVLLATDFNAANDWPAVAAFSPVGSGLTVTASRAAVGTIDDAVGNASGAIALNLGSAPASAAWRAGVSSGRLALTNLEPEFGKLTLSLDLWTRLAQPVRVRLHAFSSATAPSPSGVLEAVVVPPVAGSYFRHSLDLSAFAAPVAGGSAFDPLAPFIELQFEIDSADGWIAAPGDALRVDNVSYTSPALYVSSRTGNNSFDGRSEARPLATIQRSVDLAQPGDVVLVMDGTYTANITWVVTLFKAGTPARWIVLRGHPAGPPPQIVSGSNTWAAIKMDHTSAYLEVRGLVVRGHRPNISLAAAEANYNAAVLPAFNGNGIDADGRQGTGTRRPHHLRIIGNEVFDHCGGGISVIAGDYATVEGNTVYNNCWYMRYAGSGISYLIPTDVDGSTGTTNLRTKLFILGNTVYRNQCFVRWKELDRFSDGNGIIVDTTKETRYAGRALVQNNVAFGNGGSGIHAFDSDHVHILHNTAYYNGQSPALRWGEIFANRCADVTIANNILWAAQGRPINSVGNSNPSTNVAVAYTNNLYFGDGANFVIAGTGDVRADPQFALRPALTATSPTPADNALVGPFEVLAELYATP
jgi:parallel beta-helix repeat protein